MTAPGPPEPLAPVSGLVDNLGTQVLDTAVSLAPVAVPFVLAMAGIAWVMDKFGLNARIELSRLEAATAAKDAAREQRKARAAARKQHAFNVMHEDALATNRRRSVRKRLTGSYSRTSDF